MTARLNACCTWQALTAPFPAPQSDHTSGQGVISFYNSRSMPSQPHPPSFQDGQLVAITHLLWELLAGSALPPCPKLVLAVCTSVGRDGTVDQPDWSQGLEH